MVLVSEARSPSAPPEAFPPAVVEPLARSTAVWVNIEGGKPRETEAESLRDRIVKEGEVTVPSLSSSSWEARSFSSSGERGEASSAALPLVVAFAAMSRAPPIRMEGVSLIGRREGKRSRELTRSLKNLKGRAFFFFFFFFHSSSFFFTLPLLEGWNVFPLEGSVSKKPALLLFPMASLPFRAARGTAASCSSSMSPYPSSATTRGGAPRAPSLFPSAGTTRTARRCSSNPVAASAASAATLLRSSDASLTVG